MEFIQTLIGSIDFSSLVFTALTAIGAAIATVIKDKYQELKDKEIEEKNYSIKKETVETCVRAVEQLYSDLHGEEKFEKVVEYVQAMLAEKGLTITEIEIKMLTESFVQILNSSCDKCEEEKTCEEATEEIINSIEELVNKYAEE